MAKPQVLVLRAPGTNCDEETAFAFERAGAWAEVLHVNRFREQPTLLRRYQILALPGGFSYGDDVAAGKIFANQLGGFLGESLREFRDRGKLVLGICNGFQVLLKAGLLLQPDEDGPIATLAHNTTGRYEDRWVHLEVRPGKCPFLKDCERLYLPVAHGEGRFLCREEWIARGLEQTDQIVLRYVDEHGRRGGFPVNPNGSQGDVAGLCDPTGQILGLMPHPERHIFPTQHPQWTRRGIPEGEQDGDGMKLFRNAVAFFG
ncbi:MAG TPA: phosphoribosylformylglycinamidine synthase I [Gemmataceae bacterium]